MIRLIFRVCLKHRKLICQFSYLPARIGFYQWYHLYKQHRITTPLPVPSTPCPPRTHVNDQIMNNWGWLESTELRKEKREVAHRGISWHLVGISVKEEEMTQQFQVRELPVLIWNMLPIWETSLQQSHPTAAAGRALVARYGPGVNISPQNVYEQYTTVITMDWGPTVFATCEVSTFPQETGVPQFSVLKKCRVVCSITRFSVFPEAIQFPVFRVITFSLHIILFSMWLQENIYLVHECFIFPGRWEIYNSVCKISHLFYLS